MYELLNYSIRHRKASSRAALKEYERMASTYGPDLYRYGFWLCKDSGKTYQLVVKTFDSAWKKMAKASENRVTKAWLFSELRGGCFDKSNRPGVLQAVDKAFDEVADSSARQRPLDVQALRDAVSTLPLQYREPLVLHELSGFSCSEIGSICEISESFAKQRLLQAKRELCRIYAQSDIE